MTRTIKRDRTVDRLQGEVRNLNDANRKAAGTLQLQRDRIRELESAVANGDRQAVLIVGVLLKRLGGQVEIPMVELAAASGTVHRTDEFGKIVFTLTEAEPAAS